MAGLILAVWATQAMALPSSRRLFEAKYGYKTTCSLCHEKGGGSASNDYGKTFLRAGANFQAFPKIEKKDSDGDGVSNLDEIQARSNPGDPRSAPEKPGDWLAEAGKVPVPEKPLKEIFTGAEAFAAVEGGLNESQVALVRENTKEVLTEDDRVPTFYFAMAGGKRYGVAQFIRVEGSKQPMSVAVAIDTRGRITGIKVLKSEEDKRFAEEAFLKQFVGKSFKDPLKMGADLTAVPGQEALSQTFAGEVRKSLWIVQAVFAKR
ncbi:MAG TPA: hypothetical protein VI382_02320 [Candidatus Manganitrophaceae bacterium]|nr:hypothetical protein [Candidatus Manganitrophaceae bacterium]